MSPKLSLGFAVVVVVLVSGCGATSPPNKVTPEPDPQGGTHVTFALRNSSAEIAYVAPTLVLERDGRVIPMHLPSCAEICPTKREPTCQTEPAYPRFDPLAPGETRTWEWAGTTFVNGDECMHEVPVDAGAAAISARYGWTRTVNERFATEALDVELTASTTFAIPDVGYVEWTLPAK